MTSIFEGTQPPKKGLNSNQNKGHLGSRYIYIYMIQCDSHCPANWTFQGAESLSTEAPEASPLSTAGAVGWFDIGDDSSKTQWKVGRTFHMTFQDPGFFFKRHIMEGKGQVFFVAQVSLVQAWNFLHHATDLMPIHGELNRTIALSFTMSGIEVTWRSPKAQQESKYTTLALSLPVFFARQIPVILDLGFFFVRFTIWPLHNIYLRRHVELLQTANPWSFWTVQSVKYVKWAVLKKSYVGIL